MRLLNLHKFPIHRMSVSRFILWTGLIFCQNLWAKQMAMVIAEKAVIYADEQMSAPVGFVRKGRKINVGDIARNRAQVYPIVVSGKIAYIKVIDVSTEKESVDSKVLVAERFKKVAEKEYRTNYSLSFFNYSSQISLGHENSDLKDKDPLNWFGVSLRGGAQISPRWDLDILVNFMNGKGDKEVFRVVETGAGVSGLMVDAGRFKLKWQAQLLAVPFATYAVGSDFRVNGYGFSTGSGLNMVYRLGQNFGIEAYGGFYYTKLSGFKAPKPYKEIAPSFIGTRIGAGLNYQF